jgi:hypothetical protein
VEGDQSLRLDVREIAGCAERHWTDLPRNITPERVSMREESPFRACEHLWPQHDLVFTGHDPLLLHVGHIVVSLSIFIGLCVG